jgi:hypothetical protein
VGACCLGCRCGMALCITTALALAESMAGLTNRWRQGSCCSTTSITNSTNMTFSIGAKSYMGISQGSNKGSSSTVVRGTRRMQ